MGDKNFDKLPLRNEWRRRKREGGRNSTRKSIFNVLLFSSSSDSPGLGSCSKLPCRKREKENGFWAKKPKASINIRVKKKEIDRLRRNGPRICRQIRTEKKVPNIALLFFGLLKGTPTTFFSSLLPPSFLPSCFSCQPSPQVNRFISFSFLLRPRLLHLSLFSGPQTRGRGEKKRQMVRPSLSGGGKETFLGFNYRALFFALPSISSKVRVFRLYFSSSSLFRAHIVTHKERRRILTRPCESGKVFQLEEELGKGSPDVKPNGIAKAESVMAWKSPNTKLTLVISCHV